MSNATIGTWRGGVPRIYYTWMRPGSLTRRHFEKMQNPYADLENGHSIYYRDHRAPLEAGLVAADAYGPKGYDTSIDTHNEYKVVPDIYPEGFNFRHKLNTEYNQWRSNTWWTPELIPDEHRGRFLCNFYMNVVSTNSRIVKFGPYDSRHWCHMCVYVGTGKGIAGIGDGLAPSMQEAKKEAVKDAFANCFAVDLEDEGVRYPVNINYEGKRIMLYPSSRIVAHTVYADILCAFGFKTGGVSVRTNHEQAQGDSLNLTVKGVFEAIKQYRAVNEVAHSRGKVAASLLHNYYPYLEEVRRRKGMLAQHPPGRVQAADYFHPNRVVDNRLPDHLKRTYYDDVYHRDFFAGQPGRLSNENIGLRGDEQRARVNVPNYAQQPQPGKPMAHSIYVRTAQPRRRSLGDILTRAGKSMKELRSMEIRNPYIDQPLREHWKQNYSTT